MIVLVAIFVVVAPSALAQSPTTDQYSTTAPADDGGSAPDDAGAAPDDAGAAPADEGGSAPADDAAAPVAVKKAAPADTGGLPFTGGQVSLIALLGLALLAIGLVGHAAGRRRGATAAP